LRGDLENFVCDEHAAEAEPGGSERPRRGSQKTDRHPRRMRRRNLLSHVM